jgi:hypothetical protein
VVGGLEIVVLEETYNPTAMPALPPVLHPPADYRNEISDDQADIPTEQHQVVDSGG